MNAAKITFKLVRSFAIGITIFPPAFNGFCMELQIANFALQVWTRGKGWFAFRNYWVY